MKFSEHKYGPNIVTELSTNLYEDPMAPIREAISNALDAQNPYEEKRIEIRTNVSPDGDIEIED